MAQRLPASPVMPVSRFQPRCFRVGFSEKQHCFSLLNVTGRSLLMGPRRVKVETSVSTLICWNGLQSVATDSNLWENIRICGNGLQSDLKWVGNEKIYCYYYNSSMNMFVLNPLILKKLSHFSEIQNDALMRLEVLTL